MKPSSPTARRSSRTAAVGSARFTEASPANRSGWAVVNSATSSLLTTQPPGRCHAESSTTSTPAASISATSSSGLTRTPSRSAVPDFSSSRRTSGIGSRSGAATKLGCAQTSTIMYFSRDRRVPGGRAARAPPTGHPVSRTGCTGATGSAQVADDGAVLLLQRHDAQRGVRVDLVAHDPLVAILLLHAGLAPRGGEADLAPERRAVQRAGLRRPV